MEGKKGSEKPTLFLRTASGLTKAWSPYDLFIFNVIAINPVVQIALGYYIAAIIFPDGDLVLGVLLCTIVAVMAQPVYSLLAASMPRTGGDYIYQSRLLHPLIAVMTAFVWYYLILFIWATTGGWNASMLFLSPICIFWGQATGNPGLVELGRWWVSPIGVFVSVLIAFGWSAALNIAGIKWYGRFQKACWYIGLAGFVTWVGMMFSFSQPHFIESFNSFMQEWGWSHISYQGIINQAVAEGATISAPTNLMSTLMIIPIAGYALLWGQWGVAQLGEVKKAGSVKNMMFAITCATIVAGIMSTLLIWGVLNVAGREFYYSTVYLFNNGTTPLPIPPYFGFFVATLTKNPILQLWILGSFAAWMYGWCPNMCLPATRVTFAMAFDRLGPEWWAKLHPKTKTPVLSIIFFTVMQFLCAIPFIFYPEIGAYMSLCIITGIICLGATVLAGTLWPWTHPESYKGSLAAKYKIGPIPMITFFGVIYLACTAMMLGFMLGTPYYGFWDIKGYGVLIVLYAIPAALYFYYKWKRKREGIDLNLVYKEIPVD